MWRSGSESTMSSSSTQVLVVHGVRHLLLRQVKQKNKLNGIWSDRGDRGEDVDQRKAAHHSRHWSQMLRGHTFSFKNGERIVIILRSGRCPNKINEVSKMMSLTTRKSEQEQENSWCQINHHVHIYTDYPKENHVIASKAMKTTKYIGMDIYQSGSCKTMPCLAFACKKTEPQCSTVQT